MSVPIQMLWIEGGGGRAVCPGAICTRETEPLQLAGMCVLFYYGVYNACLQTCWGKALFG